MVARAFVLAAAVSLAACAAGPRVAVAQTFVYDTRSMIGDGSWSTVGTVYIGGLGDPAGGGIAYDDQRADDFTLSARTRLTRITVDMIDATSGAGMPADGFLVEFFANIAGNHPAEVPTATLLVPTSAVTLDGIFPNSTNPTMGTQAASVDRFTWSLSLLSGNIVLDPGTWWVSVTPKNDSDPFGTFYRWAGNSVMTGVAVAHRRCGGIDHGNNFPCSGTASNNTPDWTATSINANPGSPLNLSMRIEGDVQPGVRMYPAGGPSIADSGGNGNSNIAIDPGESAVGLYFPLYNAAADTVSGVTATLTSLSPTVTVLNGSAAYATVGHSPAATNTTPFVIALSPSHPCGQPISLRLAVSAPSDQGPGVFDLSVPTGTAQPTVITSWTGALAIPDNNVAGANQGVAVAGLAGPIANVKLRFDGTTPSTASNPTTVGLGHPNVGDLVITLTSPHGTAVTLVNRPGSPAPSTANNLYQMTLDDSASRFIQDIDNAQQPVTGPFRPTNALSAFNGEDGNGTWTLNVADRAAANSGTLRAFSLLITPSTCASPVAASGACCTGTTCQVVAGAGACQGGSTYQGDASVCGPLGNPTTCCPANYNGTDGINVQDIFDFLAAWFAGLPASDFNHVGGATVQDIFDFLAAWFVGC